MSLSAKKQNDQSEINNRLEDIICQQTKKLTEYKEKHPSQFYDDYLKYMENNLTAQQSKSIKQKLKQNNVIIEQNNFQQNLSFEIIQTDLQSYSILLHYGIYKIKINILMTQLEQSFFKASIISSGSYGIIYSVVIQKKYYAVKKILFGKQSNLDEDLLLVYKQYFLCTIASILKVGPLVQKLFGYDIIVANGSAFFTMELCQNITMLNKSQIKTQSIQNLRILHSLKFMHLDIKPSNLAYSTSFKKCVCIDFGLSLLIDNDVGYKTFTNFIGTLAYCSEEMKKIYFLRKPKFIDLYYNDSISLKNSLKKMTDYSEDVEVGQEIMYEVQNYLNVIEQSTSFFQMKFHLFFNNHEQVNKVLHQLRHMPKTFFSIMNNKTTKRFINKNELINQSLVKVRTDIIGDRSGNTADNVMSEAFQKVNQNEGAYKYIISQLILNLPNQQFETLLQNQQFISNIIFYLDDFSKEEQRNEQKQKIILKLIKKIILTKKKVCEIQFYEQIDIFLGILNQNLKKKRNYKALNILRMLFIRMEDFQSIQPLEDEIINLITNPILKCVKILQFSFFWSILFDRLKQDKIENWKEIIKTLQYYEQNQDLFQKIKHFTQAVYNNFNKRFYKGQDALHQLQLIKQFLQDPSLKQFHQELIAIQLMHLQFYRIQKQHNISNKNLRIYIAYFPSYKLLRISDETSFFILFQSYAKYFQMLINRGNPQKNLKKYQACINFVFKKFQMRPDFINQSFFIYVEQAGLLTLFFQKYVHSFEILCKKFTMFCQSQIFFCQKNIIGYVSLIDRLTIKQGFNSIQVDFILQKIHRLLHLCNQKLNLITQKGNNFFELKTYVILQKILQLHYKIHKKYQNQIIEAELNSILKQIHGQTFYDYINLLVYSEMLSTISLKFPEDTERLFEDLVLNICQNYINSQNCYLLQRGVITFQDYMRINSKRNQVQKSRILLEHMILQLQGKKKNKLKIKVMPQRSFALFCVFFCLFASPVQLKKIYLQISFKEDEFLRKCYPYYVLSIFHYIYPQFYSQKQIMLRQLKRSCLSLPRMQRYHCLKAKKMIICYCDLPYIVSKKRKKIICSRLQMRYPYQENDQPFQLNIKFLKLGANSIKNLFIKNYLLLKKIFSINN